MKTWEGGKNGWPLDILCLHAKTHKTQTGSKKKGEEKEKEVLWFFLPSVVSSTARHFSVMGDDLVMFTKTNATYVVCGLTRSILWTDMGFGHNTAI